MSNEPSDRKAMKSNEHVENAAKAQAIADELLTVGTGEKGTRLAIKLKQSDGSERDLGGRNEWSLVQAIHRVLQDVKFACRNKMNEKQAYEEFCEELDQIEDQDKRIEMIDDAIHRLNFERRWRSMSPSQIKHMCDESLTEYESKQLLEAGDNEKKREELITAFARIRYFRKSAWMCYLNGEYESPPI